MMTTIEPGIFEAPFRGTVAVPGSKSLSNRFLPLAALSGKTVHLCNVLKSEDTDVMISSLRKFGVKIDAGAADGSNYSAVIIRGEAGIFPKQEDIEIDCQNSGTTLRFLTALCALRQGRTVLTGTVRMKERPVADLGNAVRQMGIAVEYLEKAGFPPLAISGKELPQEFEVEISGKTSSQFLSALAMLMASIGKGGTLHLTAGLVSAEYFHMTVRLLESLGAKIEISADSIRIAPATLEFPAELIIEGDATAATYPLAIAAVTGGNTIVQNLYSTSWQGDIHFADIVLRKMGCTVAFIPQGLTVQGPQELLPLGTIDLQQMPDAAMTAVVLSAYAKGFSRIEGLSTLKHKESDRIAALGLNLRKMGAEVRTGDDFIEVDGDPQSLHGTEIETFDDHRIAMCFSILASVIPGVQIQNSECVGKTWPTYWEEYGKWKNQSVISP